VEVDSTCYAIPPIASVARWVSRTPAGFTFLVKAFGAFCASTIDVGSLPRGTRQILGRVLHSSTVRLNLSAFCGVGVAFRSCLGDT